MNLWKKLTASTLAVAAGAALCVAPASAQVLHPSPSAATLHNRAVINAHKATRAARTGHPKRSARLAAKAQRQYNMAFRKRMHHGY